MTKTHGTPDQQATAAELGRVADCFGWLSEVNRLRLIDLLRDGELSVTELIDATELHQSNVSRHLQGLAEGGLLHRRKEGLTVYYSVADVRLFDLIAAARELVTAPIAQAPATPPRRAAKTRKRRPAGRPASVQVVAPVAAASIGPFDENAFRIEFD